MGLLLPRLYVLLFTSKTPFVQKSVVFCSLPFSNRHRKNRLSEKVLMEFTHDRLVSRIFSATPAICCRRVNTGSDYERKPGMEGKEYGHHMHIWLLNDVDVDIIAVRICLKRDRLLNHIYNSIYFISSQGT